MTIRFASLTVTFAVLATQTFAQDDGLYAPAADPNLSYIRVIDPGTSGVTVGSEVLKEAGDGISPYIGTADGAVEVSSDNVATTLEVEPATFYTIFEAADGSAKVVTDTITNSPAKADLAFYNGTDLEDVSVFVPQADGEAMTGIGPYQPEFVALNAPLTLDFEIRAGGETVATVPGIDLRRGEGVSIILTGEAGAYEAITVNNSFVY